MILADLNTSFSSAFHTVTCPLSVIRCHWPVLLLTVRRRDDRHQTDRVTLELFHMKDVRAEGQLSVFLSRLWGNSFVYFSPHHLLFSESFFFFFLWFLEDSPLPVWLPYATAGRPGWLLEGDVPSHRRLLFCRHDKDREAFLQASVCAVRSLMTTADFPVRTLTQSHRMCVLSHSSGKLNILSSHPCKPSISFFVQPCLRRWTAVAGPEAKLKPPAVEVRNLDLFTGSFWLDMLSGLQSLNSLQFQLVNIHS